MKYKKTENNTWESLVCTCEVENIQLAYIIINHAKYPIDSKRLFGFSLIQSQSNVNCGLILHDYDCTEMTLDETRPSMFTEDEWEYLLPQLESNGLLGMPLIVFWRESILPPHIIGVLTKNHAVYFFSNYYVRLVYKVVNDEVPPELSDLFIDDGTCLKGVYARAYQLHDKQKNVIHIQQQWKQLHIQEARQHAHQYAQEGWESCIMSKNCGWCSSIFMDKEHFLSCESQ